MLHNDQLETWDRENFFHPSTHLADFARGTLPQRVIKTGKAGQLTIPLNFFGTDTFTYTLKYDGGSQPLEVELELDPEAGIYRFR